MVRTIMHCVAVAALTLAASIATAQESAPDALLKSVTAEVTTAVKQNRGHLNAVRTNQLNELIERKVLPLFDFGRMTQIALARNWSIATPEQRIVLTSEFSALLVRTYSTALRNYRDEQIDFKPLEIAPGATTATVKSVVKQNGAGRVTIDYQLEKTPVGWKVYEICMDDVNVIANYRETFASKVRNAGIDGLIKALAEKNTNYSGVSAQRASSGEDRVQLSGTAVIQP